MFNEHQSNELMNDPFLSWTAMERVFVPLGTIYILPLKTRTFGQEIGTKSAKLHHLNGIAKSLGHSSWGKEGSC